MEKYNLKSLRIINFYGAPVDEKLLEISAEVFGTVNLIYSYGQTEAGPRVTYIMRDELLKRKKSCGKAIKDVMFYIKDGHQPYMVGEVLVKGPNVMLGLYKNKELTEKVLEGGFLHTNDLGYVDEENFLYIVGRVDNMIIRAGKNVYPEEIEKVLATCKGVAEALVKGVKDELLGQKIVANIVTDNMFSDINEIIKYLMKNLEDYKVPNEIYVVEQLEKTESGKIKR